MTHDELTVRFSMLPDGGLYVRYMRWTARVRSREAFDAAYLQMVAGLDGLKAAIIDAIPELQRFATALTELGLTLEQATFRQPWWRAWMRRKAAA